MSVIEIGPCDRCGAMLYEGKPFYGVHWYEAEVCGRAILPGGDGWGDCYCARCSLGCDLSAVRLPGGVVRPERLEGLRCAWCATRLADGASVGCVELLRFGEPGLSDPERLLEHWFCEPCLVREGGQRAYLAELGE